MGRPALPVDSVKRSPFAPPLGIALAGAGIRAGAATPVAFWRHHPIADQQADTLVEATLDFQRQFAVDLVKLTPASTYQSRDYGLQDAWTGDPIGRRDVIGRVVERPEDWLTLPTLDPRQGFVARFPDAAAMVRRHTAPGVPVLASVFEPFFQASQLAGLDRLLEHIEVAPALVAAGLARIAHNTEQLIRRYVEAGVDGIFLASQQANEAVPIALYRRHGLPGALACLRAARSLPVNMLHLHGRNIHCSLFARLDGVVLHYDACPGNPAPDTLASTAFRTVSSGPSQASLLDGTAVSVAQEMMARCAGRGFVLGAGCTVPLAVPAETLHAVVEAARFPLPVRRAVLPAHA